MGERKRLLERPARLGVAVASAHPANDHERFAARSDRAPRVGEQRVAASLACRQCPRSRSSFSAFVPKL